MACSFTAKTLNVFHCIFFFLWLLPSAWVPTGRQTRTKDLAIVLCWMTLLTQLGLKSAAQGLWDCTTDHQATTIPYIFHCLISANNWLITEYVLVQITETDIFLHYLLESHSCVLLHLHISVLCKWASNSCLLFQWGSHNQIHYKVILI